MWLIFLSWSAIVMFAVIIYLVMRFVLVTENGSGYPGLEDVTSWEYEKI